MLYRSQNSVYGRTRNPYDLSRTVGGSSGGEGSIIGAGASPFGVGSDIGGSIRMPAFFNGVFGHKPSGGLIPGTGQHPVAAGVALQYLTTGPLCRRAEDLPLLVSLMMGPDHQDEGCEEFPSLQNLQEKVKQVDLSTLKVYWIDQIPAAGLSGVESSLNQALHRALSELAKLQC